jgi:hypothetical protein
MVVAVLSLPVFATNRNPLPLSAGAVTGTIDATNSLVGSHSRDGGVFFFVTA